MQEELKRRPIPEWLMADELTFNLENILENSLYYPCSGFDGAPMKYFAGNVHSFVYIDYGVSKDGCEAEMSKGLLGYHLKHYEDISENQLAPNGMKIMVYPDQEEMKSLEFHRSFMKEPFAQWAVYERDTDLSESHGPSRISLLFICGDGALTYQTLYLQNGIVPTIMAVIQPGHGFGGNYTNFYSNDKLFYKSVIYRDEADFYPEYFVTNIIYHDWLRHKNLVKRINGYRKLFLWSLDKDIQDAKTHKQA